jgi:hypothetical protein
MSKVRRQAEVVRSTLDVWFCEGFPTPPHPGGKLPTGICPPRVNFGGHNASDLHPLHLHSLTSPLYFGVE